VVAEDGKTVAGHVDEPTRSILRDRLYTAGELLRSDHLRPALEGRRTPEQLRLFEGGSVEP
jgi:hypothetical protein